MRASGELFTRLQHWPHNRDFFDTHIRHYACARFPARRTQKNPQQGGLFSEKMERMKGFEPSTFTLAR
jgi:hypothetical protein